LEYVLDELTTISATLSQTIFKCEPTSLTLDPTSTTKGFGSSEDITATLTVNEWCTASHELTVSLSELATLNTVDAETLTFKVDELVKTFNIAPK
jgi:hypothetical protein